MKMNYLSRLVWSVLVGATVIMTSCSGDDESALPEAGTDGFFVVNEGGFLNGNASLSYFNKSTKIMTNDVFLDATSRPLGDQAQSMTIFEDKGYIVVQSSSKIEVIDSKDFSSTTTITEGLSSPRYFLGISSTKGYVSDWGSDSKTGTIKVLDLMSNTVTKSIATGQGANKMIFVGNKVYVTTTGGFGSLDNNIQVISTDTDAIIKTIQVGDNPKSIVSDEAGTIWVAGTGSVVYNPDFSVDEANSTAGFIAKIVNDEVEVIFSMPSKASGPSNLEINTTASNLYFDYAGNIYTLETAGVGAGASIDIKQFINKSFYGLDLDPSTNNILGFDAGDFTSAGTMSRYDESGTLIDSYEVGIIPNGAGL
jgi:hypothetical protein